MNPMLRILLRSLLFLPLLLFLLPAPAQADAEDVVGAVVRVKAKALADARTTAILGAERQGSGVVIDASGHVLTIGYLVIEADSVEVTDAAGRTFPAAVVGYDHATGFGLLRPAGPMKLPAVRLGQSERLSEREPVLVVPFGGREAARLAFVVSRRGFTGSWEYLLDSAIYTTPPAEEWSGAALIDKHGELVGVGSLLVRDAGGGEDAVPGNVFVPVDLLKPILDGMLASGRAPGPARPWLGLTTEEIQGRLFVARVADEGPAARAGIRRGDIVLAVGEEPVASQAELYRKVWATGAAGVDVPLKVLQGASVQRLAVHSVDRMDYLRRKPAY